MDSFTEAGLKQLAQALCSDADDHDLPGSVNHSFSVPPAAVAHDVSEDAEHDEPHEPHGELQAGSTDLQPAASLSSRQQFEVNIQPVTLLSEGAVEYKPNFRKFVLETDEADPCEHFFAGGMQESEEKQWEEAIRLYTGDSVYSEMNRALREDDEDGLRSWALLCDEMFRLIFSFALKLKNMFIQKESCSEVLLMAFKQTRTQECMAG